MNEILDKLGIYDLIAVLLSGICIFTFTVLILQWVYNLNLDATLQVSETLIVLVLSYFLGLVFQEISSTIQKKLTHPDNRLLREALKTDSTSHTLLTEEEKNGVFNYVTDKLKLKEGENNDNIVYNYCKYFIINNGNTSRIDRDQSLSAISRSLSLYFALLTIVFVLSLTFNCLKMVLLVAFTFLAILLYHRCIRFTKLRYINIFRTFYYGVVVNSQTKHNKN